MAWVRLDDGFLDHPKFLQAGPLAGYLHICAIAWCNRNLTDGFIPHAQARRLVNFDGFAHRMWQGELVGGGEDVDSYDLASDLVESRLWDVVDGGWQIHDYHDYQPSAYEVRKSRSNLRAERSKAGKRAGVKPKTTARQDVSKPTSNRQANGSANRHQTNKQIVSPNPNPNSNPKEQEHLEDETSSSSVELATKQAAGLFAYWQQQCGRHKAKLSPNRRRKIVARLREGYTVEQIRQAIDGAARAAFVDDRGKRHDDIELICRTGSKLEDFIDRAETRPSPLAHLPANQQWAVQAIIEGDAAQRGDAS